MPHTAVNGAPLDPGQQARNRAVLAQREMLEAQMAEHRARKQAEADARKARLLLRRMMMVALFDGARPPPCGMGLGHLTRPPPRGHPPARAERDGGSRGA